MQCDGELGVTVPNVLRAEESHDGLPQRLEHMYFFMH